MIRPPSSWISSTASPCRRWNAGWRTSPRPSRSSSTALTATSSTCTGTPRSPRPLRADAFPPGRTSHAVGHVRRRGEGHAERVLPPPGRSATGRGRRGNATCTICMSKAAPTVWRSVPARGGNLDGFFYLNQSDYRAWQEEVRPDASPSPCCSARFPQGKLFKAIAEGWSRAGWTCRGWKRLTASRWARCGNRA